MRHLLLGLLIAMIVGGCPRRKTTVVGGSDLPDDQWSKGVWLYGQHCARCHGEEGEGGEDRPALVGPEALPATPPEGSEREVPFATAADVFGYVKANMPPLAPESVDDDDTWAIVAFVLKERGVAVPERLDASNAADVTLR